MAAAASRLLPLWFLVQAATSQHVTLRGPPASLRGAPQHSAQPSRIPRQIVLTSKQSSVEGLPRAVQANLKHTLELDPDLQMRWLDDTACAEYLQAHYGRRFAERLRNETRGSFRGDLCRAAVLFREGGFYTDLDVQFRVPLSSLVDNETTFMAAFTADGAILNALVAAEPHNAIMAATLRELRRWYDGETPNHANEEDRTTNEWMGPVTMLRGLRDVMQEHCPGVVLEERRLHPKWDCGAQRLKFYDELELNCFSDDSEVECPPARANSNFAGTRIGLFVPTASANDKRVLVAWPRFEACEGWGCNSGGWEVAGADVAKEDSPWSTEESLWVQ
mmetsp:Transcript_71827/g.166163  ORF Transcript_71827/g.166163 Transcript_71827/m.166163 type:complete len:334 (-) Transcript_71827:74-1075(-)|eukprot:CAMPEP_0171068912 /NCGR_PEP_ID=MMETSP0766_2-20121228/8840_1 /TAXON_ID=439317 /ORGANISM="Gambierdiscus australes, Strain CAWD 149" /LENGTH=333 /DNA_ID=CAMNT_0011525261 /DNA_START=57 /DNA_END=1061 /DNA_ORIENTATION=-